MRIELPYFSVDGTPGGCQQRLKSFWLRIGGCAVLAAADSCIYLAQHGYPALCPETSETVKTLKDYERFLHRLRRFVRLHLGGVRKLQWYTRGFNRYAAACGVSGLYAEPFCYRQHTLRQAEKALCAQLQAGFPVPFLLLHHADEKTGGPAKGLTWHWFILAGCAEEGGALWVKVITHGRVLWLDFAALWQGMRGRDGGMVLYRAENNGADTCAKQKI